MRRLIKELKIYMTEIEKENHLAQLRRGFALTVERTLVKKAAANQPVVVCRRDAKPCLKDAKDDLEEYRRAVSDR